MGVASDGAVSGSAGGDTVFSVNTGEVRLHFGESFGGSVVMLGSSRGFGDATQSVKVICRSSGALDGAVGRAALGSEADAAPIWDLGYAGKKSPSRVASVPLDA